LNLDHIEVERVLYRTTITGDIPVGTDGFRSQVVEGEPLTNELPTVLKQKAETLQAQPVLA
jgi:alpha-ketoglutarate-dependent sulfate ester dioxygenase